MYRLSASEGISRFEIWFRAKAFPDLFEAVTKLWWITLLITISPALFMAKFYGLEMLWIFGGPMIVAQLAVLFFHVAGVWCKTQELKRERIKAQE